MAEGVPRKWVLLRGLGREAGHWSDMRSYLQEAFPADQVLAVDLPGAGLKWREKSPLSLSAIAERLVSEVGPGPSSVIGLSLGAMVALTWAAQKPESVDGLVVINTSLRSVARPWERFTGEALWRGLMVMANRKIEGREEAILGLTSNDEKRRQEVSAEWIRIAREHPMSTENWFRQIVAASRADPPLRQITAPVLVLASRGDRLCDYRCSERLARRMNWPLRLHETSGHDLPLDDPQWIVGQIAEWRARKYH